MKKTLLPILLFFSINILLSQDTPVKINGVTKDSIYNHKIERKGAYLYYYGKQLSDSDLKSVLLYSDDEKIKGLLSKTKKENKIKAITLAGIGIGATSVVGGFATALMVTDGKMFGGGLAAGGVFLVSVSGIVMGISDGNKDRRYQKAIKLYNQKY